MAPLRSVACFVAVYVGTFCGAFVAQVPAQRMSRHTTPTTTPSTTTALSRSIALQRKGSPSTSRAPLSSTRRSTDTAVSQEGGGGAALGGAFRSATKENRQRQELPVSPLEAARGSGSGEVQEEGDGGRDLAGLRRALLLAVWLAFGAYTFGPWSPGASSDPKDIELVTHLYDALTPEKAIFFNIFNALGIFPAVMASLLCGGGAFAKGRQPVPPQPFVLGAFALGFFAVGPYLALRNYLPEVDGEGEKMPPLEKAFTGKITAVLLLAGSSYLAGNFLLALADPEAVAGFVELFSTSKLAHISTLDAMVLSVVTVDPLREDMVRRGWEPEAAKVALFAVPFVGPALWLLVRPAVVKE